MMNQEQAEKFAEEWIAAWNAHDLDRVLAHYTEGFELTTPMIALVAGDPTGTLRGKESIRAYWTKGLEKYPDLKFELLEVLTGVKSIVIYYKAVMDRLAAEVLYFDEEGRVYKSVVHYGGL